VGDHSPYADCVPRMLDRWGESPLHNVMEVSEAQG
jgi:hypothetical protein